MVIRLTDSNQKLLKELGYQIKVDATNPVINKQPFNTGDLVNLNDLNHIFAVESLYKGEGSENIS